MSPLKVRPNKKDELKAKRAQALAEIRARGLQPMLDCWQVEALTGLHRVEVHRRVTCGKFPAPKLMGKRGIAWREKDVLAWIEALPNVAYAPKVVSK